MDLPVESWEQLAEVGRRLINEKKYNMAISAFKKSLVLKEDYNTYKELGEALVSAANYPAAINALTKSIELNENWQTYQRLGCAHICNNNYPAAVDTLAKSIALNEKWQTYTTLGWALIRTNNYRAASDAFTKSIALNKNWDTYRGLGSAQFQIKHYPEAINAFKKSLALKEHWHSLQGLGFALFKTKHNHEAIKAFNNSIKLKEHRKTYQGLAWALSQANEYRESLDAIINSYALNRTERTREAICRIYSQANREKWFNKKLLYILEQSIANKNNLAEGFLKEYILISSTSLQIDTLLLRCASSMTRKKSKKQIKATDPKQLQGLKEGEIPEVKYSAEMSRLHRYIFGTSHSKLHRTSANTTIVHCGPGTMFSIGDPNSRTKHFQKISSRIKNINAEKSLLIFEFGEVDIRNNIFKVAKKKSQSIYRTADTSISRYIEFINCLKIQGFCIMIAGPHCGGGENASSISAVERNDLCAYINDALSLECRRNGFYFYTLFDKVVNQETLKEIPALYSDHHHLYLPPTKIGNALNTVLNQKIDKAFSRTESQSIFLQHEEVKSECNLVFGDIPSWYTGTKFYPGKEISSNKEKFKKEQYMLLIELPFLIHPKQITLEFQQPVANIKTTVQGVLESWDICKRSQPGNVINALSGRNCKPSKDTSIEHSFGSQKVYTEMCRYLIVRISANTTRNNLKTIKIKRWIKNL